MTEFKGNFSTQHLLPPWVSIGARNWVFIIEVPRRCLQEYLNIYFNAEAPHKAPYHYEAIEVPYGLLRVTKHDYFSSDYEGRTGTGTLRRIDVNWAFPAYRWRESPEKIRYDRQIVWVVPLAFDSNSYTMFSRQEIWGTEADMARIAITEGPRDDQIHIDVAIEGLKTFTPKSVSHLLGCMHIELNPEKTSDLGAETEGSEDLAAFLGVMYSSVQMEGQDGSKRSSEGNTLKQFRDVFNMKNAVYRAIISSHTDHTKVDNIAVYDSKSVSLDFMWSQTMARSLDKLFALTEADANSAKHGHRGHAHSIDGKEIDWDLPSLRKEVILATYFTSDIRYTVNETLHTYGN